MVLEEEESSMEEEKGWIKEGRLYDNRRKRIKKTLRRGRMEIGDYKDMKDEESERYLEESW